MQPITFHPTIESPVAHSLECKEQGQGDNFTGIERRLAMFVLIGYQVIYAAEEFCDKMFRTHEVLLSALVLTPEA